jgi:hypothetical protein
MENIEQVTISPGNENHAWISSEIATGQKVITQDNCPARCKISGKCHGTAWFNAKPGPAQVCIPKLCQWADRFAKHVEVAVSKSSTNNEQTLSARKNNE